MSDTKADETPGATPEQLPETLTIISVRSSGARALGKRDIVEAKLDIDRVRENFLNFLSGLGSLFGDRVPSAGNFELDEIGFSAEISADGEFKLLGTGVGLEATTGVTFTMRRKKSLPES
jgi:hypothetical protein